VNCRESSPGWRKSRCLAPDQMNVTFRPYDLGSDKKVTTGGEKELRDAGLDPGFRPALSTGQSGDKPNAGLHRTSVDWADCPENMNAPLKQHS